MQDRELFTLALGLIEPWFVTAVGLEVDRKELSLQIDFRKGGVFRCPGCGEGGCKAYDTEERSWRHLDFFQYATTLKARTPRISCPRCGVKPVEVPWARPGSGFTLLFEALVLQLAAAMPVKAMARLLREHDTRLWRILSWYVEDARKRRDDSEVRLVGVDETASKRGQRYVSLFADLKETRVLFVADGRKAKTVGEFAADLKAHRGVPGNVSEVCCDMSPAFVKGIQEHLPKAAITFDKFHLIKLANEAVDETRRAESKRQPELKGHRYHLLRNVGDMTSSELQFGEELLLRKSHLQTSRAFALRLALQDFYKTSSQKAETFLSRWCGWAQRSRVPAMVELGRTIRAHWAGILRWFSSGISNGKLEAINSLVQAARARAKGYRSTRYLTIIIYMIVGKLDFQSTH